MSELQFYIRHHANFLQSKFILVFNSDQVCDYFKSALPDSRFEKVSSEVAENAAKIGIMGKTVPYGYTLKLNDDEMNKLSTANWETTAQLLAEGNERLYEEAMKKQTGGEK